MLEIVIIGSGNVAQHLIKAFKKSKKIKVVQVFARNKESISHLLPISKITSDYNNLKEVPVYFIAVSDNAVAQVSSQIPFSNKVVLHTSGSVAISDLDDKNIRGSFYPVQTFSKNKNIDFTKIPICIETEQETMYKTLDLIAHSISDIVYKITSQQRKALHLAAVFVNNFTNHLYKIGNDICIENQLDFEILKPLIQETANKIVNLSPNEAQTGPAKRNDTQTINSNLNFLTNENQKEIYKLLTKSIIDNGKKL
ncbi:Rossmann-like and DUF2520 domain-containing protein [Flavobacterium sp.]|uniref:Rossmann-like and DUF2520 domain-containing protein n=1 Tax=Flavobacterium sp. TaxID=239 RepID=UPI0037535911